MKPLAKTFAIFLVVALASLSIMQITGHTTEKNFLKYIRVTKEENARLIAVHSFFNTQTHLKTLEY